MCLLNKSQKKLLRLIYKEPKTSDYLCKMLGVTLKQLNAIVQLPEKNGLLDYYRIDDSLYNVEITELGKATIQYDKTVIRKWTITMTISIVALLVAIASFVYK